MDVGRRETGHALLQQETANAVVGRGPHNRHVGRRAVGNPHLGAVDDPVIAVPLGKGAHRARIRASVGLGQTEAADCLAGGHPGQPFLLLLLGSPPINRVHRERTLHRDRASQTTVAVLELVVDQAVRDSVNTGATVALKVGTKKAQLAELGEHLARQNALVEPVANLGQDLLTDNLADGIADRLLIFAEKRIKTNVVVRIDCLVADRGHESPPGRVAIV